MPDRDYTDRPAPSDIDLMQILMEAVEGCVVDCVTYVNHAILEVKYELTTRAHGHSSEESQQMHDVVQAVRQSRLNSAKMHARRTVLFSDALAQYHLMSDEKDGMGEHTDYSDLFGSIEEIFKNFKEEE